jgi:hypothetical protein
MNYVKINYMFGSNISGTGKRSILTIEKYTIHALLNVLTNKGDGSND